MSYDKNKVLKGFKRVIDDRSLESMNKTLYEFFHLYCGFIAHYNIHGFKDYYSGRGFLEFLNNFTHPSYYLTNGKYGEWIQGMIDYAKMHEKQIRFEFDNALMNKKLNTLRHLAEELGYEITSKQSEATPLSVDESGQFSLFQL